jgi:uncharacterized repeat protein (TIGR03803 family)
MSLTYTGSLTGTAGGGVFEIAKTDTGYASTPTLLASFNGSNGAVPAAAPIVDAAGNLFGTTSAGGANGDGTLFEIAKTATGYASTPTTLVNFSGTNGLCLSDVCVNGALIADTAGNLLGMTQGGGTYTYGTVYELTGSGFVSK